MTRRLSCCGVALLACLHINVHAYASGPDVIVGDLHQTKHHTGSGPIIKDGAPYRAYSIGTVSCNIGNDVLAWIQESDQHPVIPQNLYRIKDGRIQQIGMSWLKHGFCALQLDLCQTCDPFGPNCEDHLGVGCSDPYSADLNGAQGNLGPRFEVNASTGEFLWPFSYRHQTGDAIYKRLQVRQSDLDPNQNAGAVYIAEGMYIHPEDAANGNSANNASYRRVTVNADYSLTLEDSTNRTRPALFAWRLHGNGPNQVDLGVTVKTVDVPGDGRYWVGYKVTDLGDGRWRYEYAIENLTSDRSGGAFSVPVALGATISEPYFHAPEYHSGEPFDNTPWTVAVVDGAVTWRSPEAFDVNPESNALRWATLYNFAFVSNRPPVNANVTLGLFKPGTPDAVQILASVPSAPACPGDLNSDGSVDQEDLGVVIAGYGQTVPQGTLGDLDSDGDVDQADLGVVLAYFGCVE